MELEQIYHEKTTTNKFKILTNKVLQRNKLIGWFGGAPLPQDEDQPDIPPTNTDHRKEERRNPLKRMYDEMTTTYK